MTEERELSATLRSGPVALLTAGTVLGSAAIAAVAVLFLTYLRQGGYTLAAASAAAGALGFVQIGGRAVLTVLARRMSTAVAAAVMLAAQAAGVAALLLVSGPPGSSPSSCCSGSASVSSTSPARTCSPSTPRAACSRG